MVKPVRCFKCEGRMIEGHMVDVGYGSVTQAQWQEGPVVRRWWGGIRTDREKLRGVLSYRCERCGHLENYVV